MNNKQDNALKFGHKVMQDIGITPVVAVSTLLELMMYGELRLDTEVDFFVNGDLITPEIEEKIHNAPGFHQWQDNKGIFYFHDPNGIHITYVPYYLRDKVYANIIDKQYFVWDKKHFETLQTKNYQDVTYTIPYDPIGYLEEYYGTPWDDFVGRKGWHWHHAKNLQTLDKLP